MLKRTPLYDTHVASGAKTVDFGGWDMPVNYGSQIEEHHAVRQHAGMFDVSHMRVVDLSGAGARDFLRHLVANDIAKLTPGKALYSCMLNAEGGVIDDLIIYWIEGDHFRAVVNAGTADKDIAWMGLVAETFAVQITPRPELAMVAVQGPQARAILAQVLPVQAELIAGLKIFSGAFTAVEGAEWFIARTGYTGEDGCEVVLPAAAAPAFWARLKAAGVAEAGLGARDTLRLEAGMNLYGQDMDEGVGPLESGLAWTVDLSDASRQFIGRAALEALQARGGLRQIVGLKLLDRGVLRAHLKVVTAQGEGETTSGTYSPTLAASIALARVPAGVAVGDPVQVDVRGKLLAAQVVKYPFARNGKPLI
ncbi:MAG: glycine cleavage system aminomethyltransferase GcvT [Burkholderiaceae bacterium]